ncbi:MAG: hypothetical protein MJD61_04360 [Proteobacteria bacterium]|nr:hypothetical protein [Pseudomonadota bacterium]
MGSTEDSALEDIAVDLTDGAVVGTGSFDGTIMFTGVTLTSSTTALADEDLLIYRLAADGGGALTADWPPPARPALASAGVRRHFRHHR